MDNQQIVQTVKEHLTKELQSKVTKQFEEELLTALENKKGGLCMDGKVLAEDIAAHCILCGELRIPLYLQNAQVAKQFKHGINSYSDAMLERCNQILQNHIFTVYKIEETETKRVRLYYKAACLKAVPDACIMFSKHAKFQFSKDTLVRCHIKDGYFDWSENALATKHINTDSGLTTGRDLCSTPYCIGSAVIYLYYVKYILREYDAYMQKREEYLCNQESWKDYFEEGYDRMMAQIRNPKQKYFYGFIEGEKGLNQVEICNYIAQQLHRYNKVDAPDYYKYVLINLADELASNSSGIKYDYKLPDRDHLYVLTGIDEFVKSKDYDNILYEKKCDHIIRTLSRIQEKRYLLVLGDKAALHKFLELDPKISFIFSENIFHLKNLSPDVMFQEFSRKCRFPVNEKPDFYMEFVEFIALNHNRMPLQNHDLVNYLVTYCERQGGLVLPPSKYQNEDVEQRLNDIVGLNQIKQKINDFQQYVMFWQKAKTLGRKVQKTNFHMIYTGNPGTGKTTVARLMTTLLYQMNIIEEDKLIEVERKDLVGEYIGHTAPKTAEVISRAMGGVLFIDEAYSLATPSGKDFGKEAIATLIKAMEDHSDRFVVIFAGYEMEMENFLRMNPGIASRIGYSFHFPDYSSQELTEIFRRSIYNMGFSVPEKLLPEVEGAMRYFSSMDNFGNGRFVNKYIQEVMIRHSKINPNDFDSIHQNDLPSLEDMVQVMAAKGNVMPDVEYSKEDMYVTAIHEVGHAFVHYQLTGKISFDKISIAKEMVNVRGYVRYTKMMPNIRRRSDYINTIKTALGGMCAEIVFFGEPCDGNSHDLASASEIAAIMITQIGAFDDMLFASNRMDSEKEKYLNQILQQYYKETISLIEENKEMVERVAKQLLSCKVMTGEEFQKCLAGKKLDGKLGLFHKEK